MEGATANFYVHYQVDDHDVDDEVATVLSLDEYDGDDEGTRRHGCCSSPLQRSE